MCGLPPVHSGSRWQGRGTAAAAVVFSSSPCVASVNNVLLSLFYSFSHSLVLLALAALMVAEWRCWMVVAEGHGGERGAAVVPGGEDSSSSSLCRDRSFCFLFLSPFSRLTSLSVTSLALLLQNFAPSFFLFSTTRNTRPFFVYSCFFSPFFLPSSLYL